MLGQRVQDAIPGLHLLFILSALLTHERKEKTWVDPAGRPKPPPNAGAPWRARREGRARALEEG